ncbi:TetR family transcriptional regulator [Rhodococcus sp. NPDC049939]|uniref:TetR/AcrR family transcriptional regulator n=1 Tax=Rhodococcus sp. NPDC049939 TaxID=3155511 RepID=UPI0033D95D8C
MRLTNDDAGDSRSDLTTRARIRDAAIAVFAESGFTAGLRAIAAAAGVSPGLVNHHFGSKDGLRAECDKYVLDVIRRRKAEAIATPGPAQAMKDLAEIDEYAPLFAYIVRSFQAGDGLGESLFEQMVQDAEQYLEMGVASGQVRPSRDPAARARYLTLNNVGAMLLYMQMRMHRDTPIDYREAIRDFAGDLALPALELYSEGLFSDSSMLDAYLATEDVAAQSEDAETRQPDSTTEEQK